MNRWKWVLLIFELALVALILILPQVDLPDLAFHGGTAPVLAKARLSSTPVRSAAIVAGAEASLPNPVVLAGFERSVVPTQPTSDYRLSLLCILLC
jgi:hypothetical protein